MHAAVRCSSRGSRAHLESSIEQSRAESLTDAGLVFARRPPREVRAQEATWRQHGRHRQIV